MRIKRWSIRLLRLALDPSIPMLIREEIGEDPDDGDDNDQGTPPRDPIFPRDNRDYTPYQAD